MEQLRTIEVDRPRIDHVIINSENFEFEQSTGLQETRETVASNFQRQNEASVIDIISEPEQINRIDRLEQIGRELDQFGIGERFRQQLDKLKKLSNIN